MRFVRRPAAQTKAAAWFLKRGHLALEVTLVGYFRTRPPPLGCVFRSDALLTEGEAVSMSVPTGASKEASQLGSDRWHPTGSSSSL